MARRRQHRLHLEESDGVTVHGLQQVRDAPRLPSLHETLHGDELLDAVDQQLHQLHLVVVSRMRVFSLVATHVAKVASCVGRSTESRAWTLPWDTAVKPALTQLKGKTMHRSREGLL